MLDSGDTASVFDSPEAEPIKGKVKVRLICPLYEVVTVEADKVLLPASTGDILILPERAPIFLHLKAGRMIIYNKGEQPVSYFVSSGVCEVRRNLCPVLAWGVREDKVKPENIAKQLAESERALGAVSSKMAKHEVVARIEFFRTILRLLNYQPVDVKPDASAKGKNRTKFNPYQLKADK